MQHFKDFLITLQTLDIKVIPQKPATYACKGRPAYYDLSHQSPYLSNTYRNTLRELRELALTDILNLPGEQIVFQLKRLEELKELFNKFWDRLYATKIPGSDHLTNTLYSLNLGEIFIVPPFSALDHATAENNFIDDLIDTVRSREKVLMEFRQSVLRVISLGEEPEKPLVKLVKRAEEAHPVFKEPATTEFFDLVKDYFGATDQPLLKDLLTSGTNPGTELVFKGKGNQLSDAFKQLFEANLIIGCNKVELANWIRRHFSYLDKGAIRSYSEKYLQDIISTNTKPCQSPILDVRKKDGQFTIDPIQRNNRHNKR